MRFSATLCSDKQKYSSPPFDVATLPWPQKSAASQHHNAFPLTMCRRGSNTFHPKIQTCCWWGRPLPFCRGAFLFQATIVASEISGGPGVSCWPWLSRLFGLEFGWWRFSWPLGRCGGLCSGLSWGAGRVCATYCQVVNPFEHIQAIFFIIPTPNILYLQ